MIIYFSEVPTLTELEYINKRLKSFKSDELFRKYFGADYIDALEIISVRFESARSSIIVIDLDDYSAKLVELQNNSN